MVGLLSPGLACLKCYFSVSLEELLFLLNLVIITLNIHNTAL